VSAIEKKLQSNLLPFGVRPMAERDLSQLAEIERDAFPTLFPPTSFKREMRNRLANYLVAWRRDDALRGDTSIEDGADPASDARPRLSRLLSGARSVWTRRYTTWEPGQDFLAGFVGTWYMDDEAHIVAVGVRTEYQGQGIGELLLIAAIEHAMARGTRVVTLEVRVSNITAKSLYKKYGFSAKGIRKRYYTDNREDALIMTTEPIQVPPFPAQFGAIVQDHERRWRHAERLLS
jgi:ribosomal-protein-alanine N-acetyltransferase